MSLVGFVPEIGRPHRLARGLWRARRHYQQRLAESFHPTPRRLASALGTAGGDVHFLVPALISLPHSLP
jgi:hypothetical protein